MVNFCYKKQLIFLFLLVGVSLFFFNLFCLNDSVFTDGELYISETKSLLEGGSLNKFQQMFPLKHYLMQGLFVIVPLSIEQFNKLFPFLVMLGCVLFGVLISKELFGKNYLISLIIGFCNYWVINFFALNYIEPLVCFWLLLFFYCFLKYERETGNKVILGVGMLFCIIALVFTKIIGLVLAPFLFIFLCLLLLKNKHKSFLLLSIPFLFLITNVLNKNIKGDTVLSKFIVLFENLFNFFVYSFQEYLFQFIKIVLLLFYFPPNPLLNKIVFGWSLVLFKFLFLLLVLPLFVFGVYCVFKSFFEKELFFKGIGVVVFVTFSLLVTYFIGMSVQVHPRYVIIVLPLLGLLLFKYLFELKNLFIRNSLLVLFFVFGLYGFCYSFISTVYHILV